MVRARSAFTSTPPAMPTTQNIPAHERQRAAEACRAMLAGQLPIVETVRALAELPAVRDLCASGDPELAVLDALRTETEHLAVGDSRSDLDEAALGEQDAERARLEMLVRDDVGVACRALLHRLGGS